MTNVLIKRKLSSLYAKDGWSQSAQKGMVLNAIEDYEAYKHNFLEPMRMRVYFHNSIFTYNHNDESEKHGTTIDDYTIDWESVKKDKEYSVRLDRLHIIRLNQRNYYLNLKKQMIEILDDLMNEMNN